MNPDLPRRDPTRIAEWRRLHNDPALFISQFLGEHARLPMAPFHRTLIEWHGVMGRGNLPRRRGRRYALAAPRGSAKSTVASFFLPLHDLLLHRERYIVLLSATEHQARQRLRAIRRELEKGECGRWYRSIVPGVEEHFSGNSLRLGPMQMDVFGAGTEIRGLSCGGYRPTKILLDDAEASSSCTSARARTRLHEWYSEVVEHLGDVYTHFLAVGTILHEEGLLARLIARPDHTGLRTRSIIEFAPASDLWEEWRRRLVDPEDPDRRATAREFFLAHRAEMEAGSAVLWPEKEDFEELYAQLTMQGRRSFYQEKQNQPLGPEDALFNAEAALRAIQTGAGVLEIQSTASGRSIMVRRYTDLREARRFGYLDAALGRGRARGQGDFASLAAVLLMPDGSLVLESLWARRAPPSEQVRRVFDLHAARPFELLGIEGTGFQELLMLPLEEERRRRSADPAAQTLRLEAIHPKKAKATRIGTLEPLLSNGRLALSPAVDEEFWQELSSFPRTEHDDALDAAAGAVELALRQDALGSSWSSGTRRGSPGGGRGW